MKLILFVSLLSVGVFVKADCNNQFTPQVKKSPKDLVGANFEGAKMDGVDFGGANLVGANLKRAKLQGADLEGANLVDADLERADLQGVDLRGANFEEAKMDGVDLRGAIVSKDQAEFLESLGYSGFVIKIHIK